MSQMQINYRQDVYKDDVRIVREIVESTGFFHPEEIEIAVELVEERISKGKASGYEFIFMEVDGVVQAYTCYGRIPLTRNSYDLYWIVTHNEFRNKGLGKQLLFETEKDIKRNDGIAIYAETSSRGLYLPTRMFYEKNGYLPKARFEDFYDTGDDLVMYVKRLDSPGTF